jgi:putative Holliday junction resolvase
MSRALGIDLGEARIGLAIADEMGMLAHALETVDARAKPLDRIAAIVAEKGVTTIVLGMPRNMDGTYGPAAEKARAFAEALKQATNCKVVLWDERLTSVAAQRSLHESGRDVRKSRAVIDQVAAQIILQAWMDGQAMSG